MSLNDILKTIKSEAEAEAEEIRQQGEAEVQRIETQISEELKKEQEKILTQFRSELEKKVKQVKFSQESKTKTKILEKKREILDKVYGKVIDKIVKDDKIYAEIIKKTADELPRVDEAEIVLAKGNPSTSSTSSESVDRSVLSAMLKDSARSGSSLRLKIADETIDAKGGFVLKSETLEIDNTVEALVRETRGETEIEVCGILFGEDENN